MYFAIKPFKQSNAIQTTNSNMNRLNTFPTDYGFLILLTIKSIYFPKVINTVIFLMKNNAFSLTQKLNFLNVIYVKYKDVSLMKCYVVSLVDNYRRLFILNMETVISPEALVFFTRLQGVKSQITATIRVTVLRTVNIRKTSCSEGLNNCTQAALKSSIVYPAGTLTKPGLRH
jgi:hypothetical protein